MSLVGKRDVGFRAVLGGILGHVHLFSALRRDGKTADRGGVPEWLKGTGCKPVGYAYVGSNPTPSTITGLQYAGLVRVSFVGTEAV